MFQPQSDITIGSVPWDNSYRHVLWTDISVKDNASVIMGIMGEDASIIRRQDYTYVRADSEIRVPVNAEKMYGYNYVMYKNANYSDMWFYAFVTDIKYINENCTALKLEEDVFQTWARGALDVSRDTFVERCHVDDDTVGVHTLAEPELEIQTEIVKTQVFDTLYESRYKLIIQTTSVPTDSLLPLFDYSLDLMSVGGAKYNGIFSGARYFAFDMDSSFDSDLSKWTRALVNAGGSGAVANMFMFPAAYLPPIGDDNIKYQAVAKNAGSHAVLPDDDDADIDHLVHVDVSVPVPKSIRGYTPHNNKCLTYPYTFIRLEAPGKGHNDYRYEWFNSLSSDNIKFRTYMPLDSDTQFIAVPIAYNIDTSHGREYANYGEAFYANMSNRVSWTTSSYADWAAQNSLGLLLNAGLCVAQMAPATRAVASAASMAGNIAYNQGSASTARAALPGNVIPQTAMSASSYFGRKEVEGFKEGAVGLGGMAANQYRMAHIPDKQCGSSSGNALFAIGAQKPVIRIMAPRQEHLAILDRFFDMYGYQVEVVAPPHVTGRPVWNYVKTAGFQARSVEGRQMPLDAQRTIERVFDSGVTFWHVDTAAAFGDYTQDNSIVSKSE